MIFYSILYIHVRTSYTQLVVLNGIYTSLSFVFSLAFLIKLCIDVFCYVHVFFVFPFNFFPGEGRIHLSW